MSQDRSFAATPVIFSAPPRDEAARDTSHRRAVLLNMAVIAAGLAVTILTSIEHRKD